MGDAGCASGGSRFGETAPSVAAIEPIEFRASRRQAEVLRSNIRYVPFVPGNEKIQYPVVVVIPKPRWKALQGEFHVKIGRGVSERAVSSVDVEPVRSSEIGDIQVRVAVCIVIAPNDCLREVVVRHPGFAGHVPELPRSVVAEQLAGVVLVADVQIQVPVTVVVRPRGGLRGEMLAGQPSLPCDISKASLTVVP